MRRLVEGMGLMFQYEICKLFKISQYGGRVGECLQYYIRFFLQN